jgi:hypothetical protein
LTSHPPVRSSACVNQSVTDSIFNKLIERRRSWLCFTVAGFVTETKAFEGRALIVGIPPARAAPSVLMLPFTLVQHACKLQYD